MQKIILASASPRRSDLLKQIGIPFTVMSAKGEEVITSASPDKAAEALALQKASEIADITPGPAIIIGADTVVSLEGCILGKPLDEENAFHMLKALQGKVHRVYTGVALYCKANGANNQDPRIINFSEYTEVTMYPMEDNEIRTYIAAGESMDKAGAYAIQGKCAAFIQKINGDYNTVVGLPVSRIYQLLKTLKD